MASLSRSTASSRAKARGSFQIHEDNVPSSPTSYRGSSPPKSSPYRSYRDVAVSSRAVDRPQNSIRKVESFPALPVAGSSRTSHTNGPKRERRGSILKNAETRAPLARIPLDSNTFVAPQKHAHFDLPRDQDQSDVDVPEQKCRIPDDPPPEYYSPSVKKQLALNREGRFDCILAIPNLSKENTYESDCSQDSLRPVEEEKSYYGCNIVHRHINEGPPNPESCFINGSTSTTYQLVATPIPREALTEESNIDEGHIMEEIEDVPSTPPTESELLNEPQLSDSGYAEKNRPSPLQRNSSYYSSPAGPRSPGNPFAKVEDTFEELDRLEEQFEAVNSFMSVEPILSPDKVPARSASSRRAVNSSPAGPQLKRTSSVTSKTSGSRTVTLHRNATEGQSHSRSLRKSTSMTLPSSHNSPSPKPAAIPARKSSVQRPASLMPPKPPAKSTKAPTIPTFVLPGDAIAQRLKEQREARMSQLLASQPPPPPARNPARRAPTVPDFELPGEAISRRKREEHQARLRAQEEEERKRREFKARPIRSSLAPSAGSLPRETVASRARAAAAANAESDVKGKRQSVALGAGLARSGSMLSRTSSQSRGRERSTQDASVNSRAASSSTGSMSGKRSTAASVTAEDVQLQKMRGKAVWDRDNRATGKGLEREKSQRASAAQSARKEAAERSRMLSREWAEKQRMRLKGMVNQGGKGVVA